ncbi:hypothetical protein [Flavobacterium channae]|uniref:hypothetical protein n=1 Tax=Flavobacterium channae TaxID=2897181 RepID=UPI001E2A958D|nr:hypothetical protein [Flavobacterium channae]UGS22930.1 hypothetical protein LOS89_09140 [Flavobacterium channae]
MKNLLKKAVLILILIINFSCLNNDDSSSNINSNFVGNWSGTFNGDDTGTWDVNVSSNGTVSGTAYSITFSDNYQIQGSVNNNGELTATIGTSDVGGEFIGQLNGNNANGIWNNSEAEMNGNWIGTKN